MVLQTMISIEPDPGANMKLRPHFLGALPQIGANQRHEHRTKGKGPCPRLLGQIAQIEVSARFVIFCTVETVLNLGVLTRLGYWGARRQAESDIVAFECSVHDGSPNLEHEVRSSRRPAHLLLCRHPLSAHILA